MANLSLLLFTFVSWKCQIDHELTTMHDGFQNLLLDTCISRLALLMIS